MCGRGHNVFYLFFVVTLGYGQPGTVPPENAGGEGINVISSIRVSHKVIPGEIRPQVLEALSCYPELNEVPIHFRFRRQTAPLTSRPRLLHVFRKPGKRHYVITLSTKTKKSIEPILFDKLGYEAQVGVLGHELAHIATYEFLSSGELIGLGLQMLNPHFVDRFEYRADQSCIDHGLGPQLLAWSTQVRDLLDIPEWKGFQKTFGSGRDQKDAQRYMNPETITEKMVLCPHFSIRPQAGSDQVER